MNAVVSRITLLAFATTPFVLVFAQQPGPTVAVTSEQVFKDIKVFKGVPASDLIPAMQFMAASMNYKCSDCHDPKDYAAPNKNKDTTRKMVLLQRDINEKHFNNRLEVTCMSCHNKQEKPTAMPLPNGINRRHEEMDSAPKPQDLIAKHLTKSGSVKGMLVRMGTLTGPSEATEEIETKPLELIQTTGGKFRLVSADRKIGSDGKQTWYGPNSLADESAHIFNRMGRTWQTQDDFRGLSRLTVTGQETMGKSMAVVVQGFRQATTSAEELYFDSKSGLMVRMVNFRRSTIGTVVSVTDYYDFKPQGGVQVPMKVVTTFGNGDKWVMNFKEAKVAPAVNESLFKLGG